MVSLSCMADCPGPHKFSNTELVHKLNEARDELEEAHATAPQSAWHIDCWAIFIELKSEIDSRRFMSGLEH